MCVHACVRVCVSVCVHMLEQVSTNAHITLFDFDIFILPQLPQVAYVCACACVRACVCACVCVSFCSVGHVTVSTHLAPTVSMLAYHVI